MENPYAQYYINQAGTGIPGFAGVRFQRGNGFFGRIFSNAALPLLKLLGQNALTAGYQIAKDAASGENFKSSIRKRLTEAGIEMAEKGLDRARKYAQTGTGKGQPLKRLRKRSKRKTKRRKSPKKRKNYKKEGYTGLNF